MNQPERSLHGNVNQPVRNPFDRVIRRSIYSPTTVVPLPLPRRAIQGFRRVTVAEIVKRLDVTTVAVNNWRQGSSIREPLKVITVRNGKAKRVYFLEKDLVEWLRINRPDLLEIWRCQ